MVIVLHGAGGNAQVSGVNLTEFWPCVGGRNNDCGSAGELNAQALFRSAGTFSNLFVVLSANTSTATLTIISRKNAANGAQTISVGTLATGVFTDPTNTDSIAAGDKVCCQIGATTGSAKTVTTQLIASHFSATTNTVSHLQGNSGTAAGTTFNTASTTYFFGFQGTGIGVNGNESIVKVRERVAGTFKNLQMYLSANTTTSACTLTSRINGADGNMTKSITGSTSGWFEDLVNTDTVAPGDDYNFTFITPSGTVNAVVTNVAAEFVTTTGDGQLTCMQSGGNANAANATRFFCLNGNMPAGSGTNESLKQIDARGAYTIKEMVMNIATNTVSAASTINFRKNAANGNITASIPLNTAGYFSDSTHTDVLTVGDDVCFQIVEGATGTSMVIDFVAFYSNIAVLQNIVKSLTETVTIATGSMTRIKGAVKPLTETMTVGTTAPARLSTKIRPITTTITISSPVTRLSAKQRALAAETITIATGALTRIKGAVKPLTSTVTIGATTPTRLAAKIRTATETVAISSTVTRLSSKIRTLINTITIADAVTRTVARSVIRTLTETITISTPSPTRLAAKIRTLTETVAIASTPVRLSTKIRALATEIVTISSTVARARGIVKTLTETIIISSTVARLSAKIRIITTTVTIASTPTRIKGTIRALATQTVTISDILTRLVAKTRNITETVIISSPTPPTRLAAKIRVLAQTITVADAVTRAKAGAQNIFKSLTETVTITSTVTRAQSKIRMLTEAISLTPSTVARIASKIRAPAPESVTIGAGVATRLRGLVRTSTSSLSAISTITRLAKKIRTITESITIQDQVIRKGALIEPAQPPKPSISILAQELKYVTTVSKDLQRFLFETVHLSDHAKLEVKRYSKIIRTARVKKIVRILDLVKLADDIYNKRQ